jgi:hypothetical protein
MYPILRRHTLAVGLALLGLAWPDSTSAQQTALGIFESQGGVGAVAHGGSVSYDSATMSYTVRGGGENMWAAVDAFHYVWKVASGDVTLAAEIRFLGTGGQPHRKACLLIRQNLQPDSPYADAVLHGDGLTSLQYREEPGGVTREIRANVSAPRRLRIEKRGAYVTMSLAGEDGQLRPAGGMFRITFPEPFYVGLAVCAHDNDVTETAVFSNVEFTSGGAPSTAARPELHSTLETVSISSGNRTVVHHTRGRMEAPNWTRDGSSLIYNSGGRLYQLPVTGGTPQLIETGRYTRLNNDHGLSPDGKLLAISDGTDGGSRIYLVPAAGGEPRLITPQAPSYWHGWSPDGRTLAYCAERDGNYDVYTISVDGGNETRLTTAQGLDDGPDYSPDGQYIYFNSERTGAMQIWRMDVDGSDQQQVTSDNYNNWFPHPSPDGRWIVFLSYEQDVTGHPANQDVMLRFMPAGGGDIRVLAKLFGGQGTINVPSWSPDSTRISFVSYQLVSP